MSARAQALNETQEKMRGRYETLKARPWQKSPGAVPAPLARRKSPSSALWLLCPHCASVPGWAPGPVSTGGCPGCSGRRSRAVPGAKSPKTPRAVPVADPALATGTDGSAARWELQAQGEHCWPLRGDGGGCGYGAAWSRQWDCYSLPVKGLVPGVSAMMGRGS